MNVLFKNLNSSFSEEQQKTILDFVKFIQRELPLKNDIEINFTKERVHGMTTGLRMPPNKMFILVKDRLIVDILRTIAHEWAHELQHQKLGLTGKEKVQKIGGPEEDFANIMAGILFKSFEKNHPGRERVVYNEE